MTRKATTSFLVTLLLTCFALAAQAAKYPPGPDGPGGACDDTLDIANLNNGPCRPGTACTFPSTVGCDSVYGVKGIITGIKNNGTSRTFYMQSRRVDSQWTGLDVFNGNGLTNGSIQIGDSVSVSGRVEEAFLKTAVPESGETELLGFDSNSNTLDVVVNVLSAGNSLPSVKILTVTDIRFPAVTWDNQEQASFDTGEPWENTLVRVVGPLVVGRRVYQGAVNDLPLPNCTTCSSYPGVETRSPGGGGFFAYPQGSPGDSIYIDMTSFVTMTPPAVGTVVDEVTGVLQGGGTRSGFAGITSWRVAVRSSPPNYLNSSTADLVLHNAPTVSAAFSVADDSVRVEFDRPVTEASATVADHYSLLTSERPVDYARMAGNSAVVCHIVGSWGIGDLDEVSANSMTGLANGLTQTTPQLKIFYNGVLPITTVQAPNPDSLVVCLDRSKFAGVGTTDGTRLTTIGVVTGKFFGREYYLQDEAGGARSGLKVFQPGAAMTVGNKYLVSGPITEFFGETELNAPPFVQDLGPGTTPPLYVTTIQTMDNFTCDGSQSTINGEDYEGCLVDFSHLLRARADASQAGVGGFFHAFNWNTPFDTSDIEIDATAVNNLDPEPDDVLDVKGILSFRFSQGVVFPRNNADLVKITAGVEDGTPRVVTFALRGPNPGRVARLEFGLPHNDQVELAVFDLSGRRLATLARGMFPAGRHSREWNGRTDGGAEVGSGIYFYRLKVGGETYGLRGVRIE